MKTLRNLLMLLVLMLVGSVYTQVLQLPINYLNNQHFFVNLDYEKGRTTTNDLYQAVSDVLGISTDSFILINQRSIVAKGGGGSLSLDPKNPVILLFRGSNYQQSNLVELERALFRAGWGYGNILTQNLGAKKTGLITAVYYLQSNLVELERALLGAGWDYGDMLIQSLAAKKIGAKGLVA